MCGWQTGCHPTYCGYGYPCRGIAGARAHLAGCRTSSRVKTGRLPRRSSLRVEAESTLDTQYGARGKCAVSGKSGSCSRCQPARSGTNPSSPRYSARSPNIRHKLALRCAWRDCGLRRHQLRSCPLRVSGNIRTEVLTMRWILSVLAAAAIGTTIGSPSAPDALTPEQWRERAAAYFPGWTRMGAATRPNSPITDSGRC